LALDRLRWVDDMVLIEGFVEEVAGGRLHPLRLGLSAGR
jgi:hypothetical protein